MLVTSDRSLVSTRSMFVSSDRSWPLCGPESLASAFDLPASAPVGVITGAGALAGHLAAASDLARGAAASVSTTASR